MSDRLRYALVGTGSRAQLYLDAIVGDHAEAAELVAIGDRNPGRVEWSLDRPGREALRDAARIDLRDDGPGAHADAVRALRVDRVIVTTPDATHASFVVAALGAGADAIVEKPLATTEDGVRAIAEAAERTGRSVTITFNYRYSPRNSALRRVIADGAIGAVTSVHFEWVLDTAHGADYFRRWHRDKANSGGLLIHKASHHFDLVNWWIGDIPSRVYASGGLRFYGADNARARGLGERPERGSIDSPLTDRWSLDLRADPQLRGLYLDQEGFDGYLRDRDVCDPGISIEDDLSLVVDYAGGPSMSYSLDAHSPWEGYSIAVNGTEGRAELSVVERGAVILDEDGRIAVDPRARPDAVVAERTRPVSERLVVQKHFAAAEEIPIPSGEGGDGGGDAILLSDVFRGASDDPLHRTAGWQDGVRAVAVGLAGNRSLVGVQAVRVGDLDLGPAAAALVRAR